MYLSPYVVYNELTIKKKCYIEVDVLVNTFSNLEANLSTERFFQKWSNSMIAFIFHGSSKDNPSQNNAMAFQFLSA